MGGYIPDSLNPNRERILEREVARQWLFAHAEKCGAWVPPWPHAGMCHWPLPKVLADLSTNEALTLLLEVWEEIDK